MEQLANQKILILGLGVSGRNAANFCAARGASVLAARDFYKIDGEDILVVCDDFHLDLGTLRMRAQGSSGGQKGLEDVLRRLGTQQINRLRIGVGPVPERIDPADFVLGRFTSAQTTEAQLQINRAADAVITWAEAGIATAMNRFN